MTTKFFTPDINALVDQQERLKGEIDQLQMPRDILLDYIKTADLVRDWLDLPMEQFIDKYQLPEKK